MVEIFKTDVCNTQEAADVVTALKHLLPLHKINFDLQDCDKVLRIEGVGIINHVIIETVIGKGFQCKLLN